MLLPIRSCLATLIAISLVTVFPVASATPGTRTRRTSARVPESVSLGLPYRGSLRNGVLLRESRTIRYTTEYRRGGNFWGTNELVQLLERAAQRVARQHRGARLNVGELSARRGGHLAGHRSHQSGRDVDLAFYMMDGRGGAVVPYAFAAFDRHGRGLAPNGGLRFDDAKNWALIASLLSDRSGLVRRIFVADTLSARLVAEARRQRASRTLVQRASQVFAQPTHGHPHRNHFHVRIACPPSDRPQCR